MTTDLFSPAEQELMAARAALTEAQRRAANEHKLACEWIVVAASRRRAAWLESLRNESAESVAAYELAKREEAGCVVGALEAGRAALNAGVPSMIVRANQI